MTTKKIYGPWIKWHGGECPVPPNTKVVLKLRNGNVLGTRRATVYRWHHVNDGGDIVKYCTAIEQADIEAAEKILLANDYTVIPPTKPLTFEDVEPMTEAPPLGTEYWVASPMSREAVYSVPFGDDSFDRLAIQRRMAYPNKEHALIAARHIFGLKGGEL